MIKTAMGKQLFLSVMYKRDRFVHQVGNLVVKTICSSFPLSYHVPLLVQESRKYWRGFVYLTD